MKQILTNGRGLGQMERGERVIASGVTEWAEEAAEYGEPAVDLGPICGGTRGKLTRQRELLRLWEEGDGVL